MNNTDQFDWVDFYKEFAAKLLQFRNDRAGLVENVKKIYEITGLQMPTLERDDQLVDIDPFTVFGLFNKSSMKKENRMQILSAVAQIFYISVPVPTSFDSIPVLNNLNSAFYRFVDKRAENDIDDLWELFSAALAYASEPSADNRTRLSKYFDLTINKKRNGNSKITMGMYWIAPDTFLNLVQRNTWYIYESGKMPAELVQTLPEIETKLSAEKYFDIVKKLRDFLQSDKSEIKDFRELSFEAWRYSEQVNEEKRVKKEKNKTDWFPTLGEYDPGLSAEDWYSLLNDPEIFDENSLFVVKAFLDIGGQATCKQLSEEYGRDPGFYNIISTKLAKRIHKKTNCPIMPRDSHNSRWWPILYLGNPAKGDVSGYYIWRLREELKDALSMLIAEKEHQGITEEQKIEHPAYTKNNFLKEVFITEKEYTKLRSLILRKKNIILQGAPGVGKTFSAKRLAYSIIGEENDDRICMVQFHQNYSYEDLIMGYRPNENGGFSLQKGVFYKFCEKCIETPDKQYFFIIDEINRGNLSKIFGELLMLIETDKRGEKHKLDLVYGGTKFYIPENLHIIGMMNTADRSLAMIDYALRRRFSFYTMRPAFENAGQNGFDEYTKNVNYGSYHAVITKIKELNEAIRKDNTLGRGFEIGHSYFSPDDITVINDDWVHDVVEYEIIPLIEEYWFDDEEKVDTWTKALYQALGDEYDQ